MIVLGKIYVIPAKANLGETSIRGTSYLRRCVVLQKARLRGDYEEF
jgi:hypothetical protein